MSVSLLEWLPECNREAIKGPPKARGLRDAHRPGSRRRSGKHSGVPFRFRRKPRAAPGSRPLHRSLAPTRCGFQTGVAAGERFRLTTIGDRHWPLRCRLALRQVGLNWGIGSRLAPNSSNPGVICPRIRLAAHGAVCFPLHPLRGVTSAKRCAQRIRQGCLGSSVGRAVDS